MSFKALRVGLPLLITLAGSAGRVSADTFRIEIDYMVDGGGHSHMPDPEVIEAVVQMFACQGHQLIIEVDDPITHYNVLRRDPDDCSASLFEFDRSIASYGRLKALNFDHDHDDGWHYCIFAHQYEDQECRTSGSSGLGETPGWNFIVTLGSFDNNVGTAFDKAATLAHEFGHNLGLSHCGFIDCDGRGPYSTNLPSLMSYRYQLAGVQSNLMCFGLAPPEALSLFKNMDYSHGTMCGLNESALNEFFGTGMIAVDWDCDGTLESNVVQDLGGDGSGWCSADGPRSFVYDKNEWVVIRDPGSGPVLQSREISCITSAEWEEVKWEMAAGGCAPQPTLTIESCVQGKNVYVGLGGLNNGRCDSPYESVQEAHDFSPDDSVFFLLPGIIQENGPVLLDKPGEYLSVGTATIIIN